MSDHKTKNAETDGFAITNDWPEDLPITEAELDLFETHMLDIITAMIQHD